MDSRSQYVDYKPPLKMASRKVGCLEIYLRNVQKLYEENIKFTGLILTLELTKHKMGSKISQKTCCLRDRFSNKCKMRVMNYSQ